MLSLSNIFQRVGIPARNKGFSLIEMAVVMVIVGLLLSGLFVALGDSAANRNRITATADLEGIKEAFYGFAQATGRLPCPAVVASAGVEAPNGGGACTRGHGFIPAVTLGLQGAVDSNGLLLDPWGNPYRYSISVTAMGISNPFTTTAELKNLFGTGALTNPPAGLLCIAGAVACGSAIYANTVPALIYSMGADWAIYTSAVQLENASTPLVSGFRMATDNNFVNGTYAEEGSNAFDDILVWLSPNILYSRLITAGKLP
jgi:prepilin-type N-terminal cleavage/methylation domain-containing protein